MGKGFKWGGGPYCGGCGAECIWIRDIHDLSGRKWNLGDPDETEHECEEAVASWAK